MTNLRNVYEDRFGPPLTPARIPRHLYLAYLICPPNCAPTSPADVL